LQGWCKKYGIRHPFATRPIAELAALLIVFDHTAIGRVGRGKNFTACRVARKLKLRAAASLVTNVRVL
jgi:hypothetical protein